MSELQDNLEAAVANAAAKLASADTIDEAQQWQSVISNLTGSLQTFKNAEAAASVPDAVVVDETKEDK